MFQDGATPLSIACQKGHIGVADLLIKKSADLNLKHEVSNRYLILEGCLVILVHGWCDISIAYCT